MYRQGQHTFYELGSGCTLQFRRHGRGIGPVPRPLSLLDEAFPTAYDLTRKVGSQRCEASTKLKLRPLPRRQSSLCSFRSSNVVRRWVWMADERVLCDTQRRPRAVLRGVLSGREHGSRDRAQAPCLGPLARGCSDGDTYLDFLDGLPFWTQSFFRNGIITHCCRAPSLPIHHGAWIGQASSPAL